MALFDISRVKTDTVREIYKRALRRRDYIEVSVKDAFGAHRAPILTSFTDENAFNVHARCGDNAYHRGRQIPSLAAASAVRKAAE